MSDSLRRFFERELPDQAATLRDDDSLLEARLLDSVQIINLVAWLEKHEGITIRDQDIVPDNFRSLNHIRAFIARCRSGSA
jgi:acyl carrier protein